MYNWTPLKSKIILKFQEHNCLDKFHAYYQNKNKSDVHEITVWID